MAFEDLSPRTYPDMGTDSVAKLTVAFLAERERRKQQHPDEEIPKERLNPGQMLKRLSGSRKEREQYALRAYSLREDLPNYNLLPSQRMALTTAYDLITANLLEVEI